MIAQWMGKVNAETNKNQTLRFCVDILNFLGAYVGYYFSVRSEKLVITDLLLLCPTAINVCL